MQRFDRKLFDLLCAVAPKHESVPEAGPRSGGKGWGKGFDGECRFCGKKARAWQAEQKRAVHEESSEPPQKRYKKAWPAEGGA